MQACSAEHGTQESMADDNVIDDKASTSNESSNESTQRARSNSVIDSIGFRKSAVLASPTTRRRCNSLTTTDYYTSPEEYQRTQHDSPYTTGTVQSDDLQKLDTTDAKSFATLEKLQDTIAKAEPSVPSKIAVFTSVEKNADRYDMNHKNRGKCIIFNHEKFHFNNFTMREGTNLDMDRLLKVFTKLGFDVEVHNDFTHSEIMDTIAEVSKLDHTDNDCLCIITLTHGLHNDLLSAKDVIYSSDKLWKPFTADKCLTLAGKPKLFFFQACRGGEGDPAVQVSTRFLAQSETDSASSYTIPTHADFLIAHSSVQGFYTWRNPSEGTWYIQSLCDILEEHGTTMDLMSMLTLTARKVATDYASVNPDNVTLHDKKQVPSVTTMLIRTVYFPPKST